MLELPEFPSENVAIDVQQNRLTISGESTTPDSEEQRNYVVRERRSGTFFRTLRLPFGIKVCSWCGFSQTRRAVCIVPACRSPWDLQGVPHPRRPWTLS